MNYIMEPYSRDKLSKHACCAFVTVVSFAKGTNYFCLSSTYDEFTRIGPIIGDKTSSGVYVGWDAWWKMSRLIAFIVFLLI